MFLFSSAQRPSPVLQRALVVLLFFFAQPAGMLHAAWDAIVWQDEFDYSGAPDPSKWGLNHSGESWFRLGRSFLPAPDLHPAGPFPTVADGRCTLKHYHYNPYHLGSPKTTFLGGEIRSLETLTPDRNYRVESRVRNHLYPDGLITSFFLYGYDGTTSDEIDFEFASRQTNDDSRWPPTGGDPVLTNTWNESRQEPEWAQTPGLALADGGWDTFVLYWFPGKHRVEWYYVHPDGGEALVRSETDASFVPDEGMNIYFNFWAAFPDDVWDGVPVGSPNLQPDQEDHGTSYAYDIDYVRVSASPFGDFDFDGDVDLADLLVWQRGQGALYDDTDLADWRDGFGACIGGVAGAVPEPAAVVLLVLAQLCAAGSSLARYTRSREPVDKESAGRGHHNTVA